VERADNTLFNLVPYTQELERAFAQFLRGASDVVAFAKNQGPQCLRIDYLAEGHRLAFYTPDFFIRAKDGTRFLVETKGQTDLDVPRKARAATEWCKAAGRPKAPWEYLYVPESAFLGARGSKGIEEFARACRPALNSLLREQDDTERYPLFPDHFRKSDDARASLPPSLVPEAVLASLLPRQRDAAEQSAVLFAFMDDRKGMNYAACFVSLLGPLDGAARVLIEKRLSPLLPWEKEAQTEWFAPHLDALPKREQSYYVNAIGNLKRTLLYNNGISPIGLLRFCLEHAVRDGNRFGGVLAAVRQRFGFPEAESLLEDVEAMNELRNTKVAHQEEPFKDSGEAKEGLAHWLALLARLSKMARDL
jgi:type III restriction enzyme